jgi:hypothetical protein
VDGGPDIQPVNTTPFTDATVPGLNADPVAPITKPEYLHPFLAGKLPPVGLPAGLNDAATIKDPTRILQAVINDQKIIRTAVLKISTVPPGALVNIPFIQKNASATQMDAIFWIETVELPSGRTFLQLQYVQRVILNFVNIQWPHVSVATLRRL